MAKSVNVLDRFWKHTDDSGGADNCWWWTAVKHGIGYGAFSVLPGRTIKAHRFAWEWANAVEVPHGMQVCHRCDHPSCVNPAHLFLGTALDNNRDKVAKGRQATGIRINKNRTLRTGADSWSATHPERLARGERQWKAVLTEARVADMRAAHGEGETVASLARRYGVAYPTARAAIRGRTWRHVQGQLPP